MCWTDACWSSISWTAPSRYASSCGRPPPPIRGPPAHRRRILCPAGGGAEPAFDRSQCLGNLAQRAAGRYLVCVHAGAAGLIGAGWSCWWRRCSSGSMRVAAGGAAALDHQAAPARTARASPDYWAAQQAIRQNLEVAVCRRHPATDALLRDGRCPAESGQRSPISRRRPSAIQNQLNYESFAAAAVGGEYEQAPSCVSRPAQRFCISPHDPRGI